MQGYICRSKNTDRVIISVGSKPPEKKNHWYWHIPGWFYTMPVQTFKKTFGFSIKPDTHQSIDIMIIKKGTI